MNLRIGHLSTFYHTAVLLMARRDLCEGLGFEPEWRLFPTGPAIIEAFRRGELDFAYLGLPPAMIGIASGAAIKCIAGGHVEGTVLVGRSGALGYPATEDLEQVLAQYRGKRIGVPGTGTIHDVILRSALRRYGLSGEVEIVHFPWADAIVEAMRREEISAGCGTPALAVSARRYAGGRLLFPAEQLWPDNPSYGILASLETIREHHDLLVGFIEAHESATQFIRRTPREAAGCIARYFGLVDENFVMDTFRISPKYCAQITDAYLRSTMAFVPELRRFGFIDRDLSVEDVFDLSLIQEAHGPGSHYRTGISLCGEKHLFHPGQIEITPLKG